MKEDPNVIAARAYIKLHEMLSEQMPKKDGLHIYATGNMFSNLKTIYEKQNVQRNSCIEVQYKWTIIMSDGVPYSAYAMGYRDDGSKRTPRNSKTGLEKINFATVDNCMRDVARSLAIPSFGKVVIK